MPNQSTSHPEGQLTELEDLVRALEDPELGMDSIMVLYQGQRVLERYWNGCTSSMPHAMYSVTKTLTATAIGIAVDEKLLDIDEPLVDLLGEDASGVDTSITLRHLLTMSSGRVTVDSDVRFLTSKEAVQRFAALEQVTEPGSAFAYCSLSSHILSLALKKRSAVTLLGYLLPRLFRPLGISTPAWETDLSGNQIGGSGLFLRTDDLVRLGMLFLGHGIFNGTQIFSKSWHHAATAMQVPTEVPNEARTEWLQGYGYQMWRGTHDTYRADGMLGQFVIVQPDLDMLIATTARSHHTDRILASIQPLLLKSTDSGSTFDISANESSPEQHEFPKDYTDR